MKTVVEFRIPESNAAAVLSPSDGVLLGDSVRKLVMTLPDDRLALVGRAEAERRAIGRTFFTAWNVTRIYTRAELNGAQALAVDVARTFEPAGEECGTVYTEDEACILCGAGARRTGELWLPLRSIPKGVDAARTIAGEVVISHRFAEALLVANLSGFDIRPVRDGRASAATAARYELLERDPLLLDEAESMGIEPGSTRYLVWLGEATQSRMVMQARKHLGLPQRSDALHAWYELVVPQTVEVGAGTRFGEDLFSSSASRPDQCPLGHVLGLNRLSELAVVSGSWVDDDVAATIQYVGVRRGLLRPEPMLLGSQRFRDVVEGEGLKGLTFEVAHLGCS